MPTELTLKNQYHYEGVFKGDIAPLNFKNLRITDFLEHPSKLSELLLLDILSNRLMTNKDKKTLDNE